MSNQIDYISKEYEKDYFDNDKKLRVTDKFTDIDSFDEVQNVVHLLSIVMYTLGRVCKSKEQKNNTNFKHIMTKKDFIRHEDGWSTEFYQKLSFYIILPEYSDLRKKILLEIKED